MGNFDPGPPAKQLEGCTGGKRHSLVGSWDSKVVTDTRIPIPTSLSLDTFGENTVNRLLSTNGGIEEVHLVPNGWRDRNENEQCHGGECKEKTWECW